MGVEAQRPSLQTPTSLSLPSALPDMSANDPGFMLFGQKMSSSSSQTPATSSPIPSNSLPEHDGSSSKKSEAGTRSTENLEQQSERQKNDPTKISSTEEFKMMKKPDKIQQCPRCNSMDTKFCYFNNYNVNQPRHFCKSCHRYWTAGGAMRNVPVGAGRRRHRQLSSPYHRHTATTISSDGTPVPTPNTDLSSHQRLSTLESSPSGFKSSAAADNTSTVLRFGPETPVSESASSILSLGIWEESSGCGSSVTNNASVARGNEASELAMQWNRGVSNLLMNTSNGVRCYPAAPWLFPAPLYAENKITSQNIPIQFVAAPCWSNGTGASIGSNNGCLSYSSSTSNGPSHGKHQ